MRATVSCRDKRAFDGNMAFYPKELERSWRALSGFITRETLARCGIGQGTRVVPGDPDAEIRAAQIGGLTPYFDDVPRAPVFTHEAVSRQPKGMSPQEVSAMNMEPALRLEHALTCFGEDGWRGLVGEFQLAFVLLVGLSSMCALEQWKRLAHVVCACADVAVFAHADLYVNFIDAIEAHLDRAGEDFFVDDFSDDNFLRPCLVSLMQIDVNNCPKDEITDIDFEEKLGMIEKKLKRLADVVKRKFNINLIKEALEQRQRDTDDPAEEDAPIIVELSEGHYMSMHATHPGDDDDDTEIRHTFASHDTESARMAWMVPADDVQKTPPHDHSPSSIQPSLETY